MDLKENAIVVQHIGIPDISKKDAKCYIYDLKCYRLYE